MSKLAVEILRTFYLRLRDPSTSADSTPITARQLEILVRLAEARARVDLRSEVTAEDAQVKLVEYCRSCSDLYTWFLGKLSSFVIFHSQPTIKSNLKT